MRDDNQQDGRGPEDRPEDRLRWRGRRTVSAWRALRLTLCAPLSAWPFGPPAVAGELPFLAPAGVPATAFPRPHRPHAPIISPIWHTEGEREAAEEARQIVRLLGLGPGMTVGDIGAGSGYHTVRLARVVAPGGRVIAQDIVPEYLAGLARRVKDMRLENVTIGRGEAHDPRLPHASLDAAIMVHMYHEIAAPFAFLHNLAPAFKPGARLGIVDLDKPILEHGTPLALLRCELAAVGYRQEALHRLTGLPAYLAVFTSPAMPARKSPRKSPGDYATDVASCRDPR